MLAALVTSTLPAAAGTIGISGATLIFGADADEQITLTGSTSATDLLLTGATFDIVTPGCVPNGANGVRCALSGFTSLTLIGSERDDVFVLTGLTNLFVFVAARGGDDVIIGSGGGDVLEGGDGNDLIMGGPGGDHLFGDAGANVLINGLGGLDQEPPEPVALPHAVPEPATLLLVAGGFGSAVIRFRRTRARPEYADATRSATRSPGRPSIRRRTGPGRVENVRPYDTCPTSGRR